MTYSVVIATYNRAADLRGTLDSLAAPAPDGRLGSDRRRQQLDRRHAHRRRRRGARLSRRRCAISSSRTRAAAPRSTPASASASGAIIVTTDDDVRVGPDWLDRAAAGLAALDCDYVGGRVLPIWGGERPAWLPDHGGKHWAVIALLDYGPAPIEFGARVPLGVNMAFRRERVRSGRTLRSGHRPKGRHAARPGSARMVYPGARRRRPRVLPARHGRAASHPGSAAEQALLPAVVLLARDQPGASVRAGRPRHGSAGADQPRLQHGCRTSSACHGISIARRQRARPAALIANDNASARGGVRSGALALVLCRHRAAALAGSRGAGRANGAPPGGVRTRR